MQEGPRHTSVTGHILNLAAVVIVFVSAETKLNRSYSLQIDMNSMEPTELQIFSEYSLEFIFFRPHVRK